MGAADVAYVAQFGEHQAWNDLHDAHSWQPLSPLQVNESQKVQEAHFNAFFRPRHALRHALAPAQRLGWKMRIVLHCLGRWAAASVWFRLHASLRARAILKRRMRQFCTGAAKHRQETLESWLEYWRDSESKAQDELRTRLRNTRAMTGMTAERAGQVALAQVMTSTCDAVKCRVLWQLYWLLRAQVAVQRMEHWARWQGLLQQRCTLLSRFEVSGRPLPHHAGPDFQSQSPVSLRAINATLFLLALQTPRFRYRAGVEVTFKELVRLSNAPQRVFHPGEPEARLRHASAVVTAFADSPLCSSRAWLVQRHAMPVPIIPQIAWRLPMCPDADDTEVDERVDPTQLRRVRPPLLRSHSARFASPVHRRLPRATSDALLPAGGVSSSPERPRQLPALPSPPSSPPKSPPADFPRALSALDSLGSADVVIFSRQLGTSRSPTKAVLRPPRHATLLASRGPDGAAGLLVEDD
eukprot:EG_transcript_11851